MAYLGKQGIVMKQLSLPALLTSALGTRGAVALDARGNIAADISTGGMTAKR